MSDYRNAYENYYKNINNSHSTIERKLSFRHNKQSRIMNSKETKNSIEKILFRQSIGAVSVLAYFCVLKYIPLNNIQYLYSQSKSIISKNVSYDDMIDSIKTINVGGYKAEDININGFTIDDLKEKPIKNRISQCFNYINQIDNNEDKQI